MQAREAFVEISTRLRRLGYMEDNNRMVHDYLHFMIKDLFDYHRETYITESEIRGSANIINGLLNGVTPDFILKKKNGRPKTLIIDIYVGDKPASEIKSKYRSLGFFADLVVITPHDFCSQLKGVIPPQDIDYLYKNYHVFLVEYYYWKACMKLQKILFNDTQNVPQRDISVDVDPLPRHKYLASLEEYAAKVCAQEDL